jgi:hypothetical protein
MKLGSESFNKSAINNLKQLVNHQDTIPRQKRWNPWGLAKNLTKVIILAGVVIMLLKIIFSVVSE